MSRTLPGCRHACIALAPDESTDAYAGAGAQRNRSERAMRALQELINRIRAWRPWKALGRPSVTPPAARPLIIADVRPILREVTPHGVRVYSLCGQCGAQLNASATLCDACARSRSLPNS